MRDEIIAGIRNAIARGQSVEQAARSMINAGYNPQEVKIAVQSVSTGVSNMVSNLRTGDKNSKTSVASLSLPENADKRSLP